VEKEMLSIYEGCKKFHIIYGYNVVIQTDHLPLVSVFKKPVHKINNQRLKRMRISLLVYKLDVQYVPGCKMYMADTLSRAYLTENVSFDPDSVTMIHTLSKHLPISSERKLEFQRETKKDAVLNQVMTLSQNAWKVTENHLSKDVQYFYNIRAEIDVDDGLVFVGGKLVVPSVLKSYVLNKVHEGHVKGGKAVTKARQVLFWRGMSQDILNFEKTCRVCEKFSRANSKSPMLSHDVPDYPFQKIGADILDFEGKSFLIVVCYLSKWFQVIPLTDKSAKSVNDALTEMSMTHGFPETMIADNVPFNSWACRKFAAEHNFEIVTSSPKYPKANGLAEIYCGVTKNLKKKCREEGSDFREALREYRNTPLAGYEYSPAQILMSRRLKTGLPVRAELLKPQIPADYINQVKEKKLKIKAQHDKTARRAEKRYQVGEKIVERTPHAKTWEHGEIIKVHETPRSYVVKTAKGTVVRRNQEHLRSTVISSEDECNNSLQYWFWPNFAEENGVANSACENIVAEPNNVVAEPNNNVAEPGNDIVEHTNVVAEPGNDIAEPNNVAEPNDNVVEPQNGVAGVANYALEDVNEPENCVGNNAPKKCGQ